MKKSLLLPFTFLSAVLLGSVGSNAAVIVGVATNDLVDNSDGTLSTSDPNGFVATGLNAVTFNTNNLMVANNGAPGGGAQYRMNSFANNGTAANAMTLNDRYISFTLASQSGFQFSLDASNTIQFELRFFESANGGGDTVDDVLLLRSSLDNFQSNTSTIASDGTSGLRSFNVGSGFSNLSGPVEFRIYKVDPQNDSVGSGPDRIAFREVNFNSTTRDIIINGNVALIPEPQTFAMLSCGAGLLLLLRRRRTGLSFR